MNDIRIAHVEMKVDRRGKIIAAVVIGLAILGGATRMYENGWRMGPPKPVVARNQLPSPTPLIENGMAHPR